MQTRDFTDAAPGRLVTAAEGYPAFVPDFAPRSLELSPEAVALLDEASNRLGELRGVGRLLANPQLVISPYLRREALLSSRIEGTQATMSDVYAAEVDRPELRETPDVREVINYTDAQRYALRELGSLSLSLRLIRGIHRVLMTGVRGRERHPGEFRSYQNWIGGTAGDNATYVPPPPLEMRRGLDDFERFLHEAVLPPLVQAAVAHYLFEAIHPFGDGNGRVGRLLVAVFLAERDLLPQPLLYLSAYFERTRTDYYDRLLAVSTHGDWNGWLTYFLTGVREQAAEASALADRIIGLHADYRERLQAKHATATMLALVDLLFVNPRVTSRRVQDELTVSAPTARKAIRSLEEDGILSEVSGRKWRAVYEAGEIYEVASGEASSESEHG